LPQKRDFDVAPNANEKSLIPITLTIRAPGVQNPSGQLSSTQTGRARVKIWDTPTKANEITLPAEWHLAQLPKTLYVEGTVNGAAEREIDLTLELLDGADTSLASDTLTWTVTPVLVDLRVTVTAGAAPGLLVVGNQLQLSTGAGLQGKTQPLTYRAEAIRLKLMGTLEHGQKARVINNLPRAKGATSQTSPRRWISPERTLAIT